MSHPRPPVEPHDSSGKSDRAVRSTAAAIIDWIRNNLAAVAAALGALAYLLLYVLHAVFLSQLGLSASDVGIDRDRLLGGPLVGLIVTALLLGGFSVAVTMLLAGTSRGLASMRRWPRVATVAALAAAVALGAVISYRTRDSTLLVVAMLGPPTPLAIYGFARGSASPAARTIPIRWWLGLAAFYSFAMVLAVGAGTAIDAARAVRHGDTFSTGLFGVPVYAVRAHEIRLLGKDDALGRASRVHPECLIHLGSSGEQTVFWDVRLGEPLLAHLPKEQFILRPADGQLPLHCSPDPAISDEDTAIATTSVNGVRASGGSLGWQRRTGSGWEIAIVSDSGFVHRILGRKLRRATRWDLGDDGNSAVRVACVGERCPIALWRPLSVSRPLRLKRPVPNCAVDALAVTRSHVYVAQTATSCRRRGIWRHVARRWTRVMVVPPRERVVSLDADSRGFAWASQGQPTATVRWQPLRRRTRVITTEFRTGSYSYSTLSSVTLDGQSIRWGVSTAYRGFERTNQLLERELPRDGCGPGPILSLAEELSAPRDRGGVDAVALPRAIIHASREHPLRRPSQRKLVSARPSSDDPGRCRGLLDSEESRSSGTWSR